MTASYRREALSRFLVQAKLQTYASQGDLRDKEWQLMVSGGIGRISCRRRFP